MLRRPPNRYAPGHLIDVEGWPVRLAVNARARRISLRLDAVRREVVATAPSPRALSEAVTFAKSRSAWIAAHLDRLPKGAAFAPGEMIEVAGALCRLELAATRVAPRLVSATTQEPARLLAYGEGDAYARAVERGLRAEALRRLTERTAVHCTRLGVAAPKPSLTDTRARWGSCRKPVAGRAAAIRYSWRLILAPAFVLDYVAAHECAHLVEANHGPRFWALNRDLHGDVAPARAWLKLNGARLHAVGRG